MVYLPGRIRTTRSRRPYRLSERRIETPLSPIEQAKRDREKAAEDSARAQADALANMERSYQEECVRLRTVQEQNQQRRQREAEAREREQQRLEAIRKEQSQRNADAWAADMEKESLFPPYTSPDERAACEKRMAELGIPLNMENAFAVAKRLREIGDISEQMFRDLPRSSSQPVASEGFKKSVFDAILNPELDMKGVLHNWQAEILKGRK